MRCYEITDQIVAGLPLTIPEAGPPYVLVSGRGGTVTNFAGRARLADPLSNLVHAVSRDGVLAPTRLLRCEFEETSELWLTQEVVPSNNALVLFVAHNVEGYTPGLGFDLKKINKPDALKFSVSGDCRIIAQCEFQRSFIYPFIDFAAGKAVLAVLGPNGLIESSETVVSTTGVLLKSAQRKEIPLASLGTRSDGTLFLDFKDGKAFRLASLAAGGHTPKCDFGG